jgi:hypothetical protein
VAPQVPPLRLLMLLVLLLLLLMQLMLPLAAGSAAQISGGRVALAASAACGPSRA